MNICVFSSSSNGIKDIYFEEAQKLGQLIGQSGDTLINGGANVGLMETVTLAAREAGQKQWASSLKNEKSQPGFNQFTQGSHHRGYATKKVKNARNV